MRPSSACASDITPSTFHASCKFEINEDVYWPEMAMLSLWGSWWQPVSVAVNTLHHMLCFILHTQQLHTELPAQHTYRVVNNYSSSLGSSTVHFFQRLPTYVQIYRHTHTCRDTQRRHTVSEPSSLDLLTGLWLMWHILSPCSDAQRWATMVGVARTHTHILHVHIFQAHTPHTCTHRHTHIKHGSGDLCLADFNHARWPLDDEWQAAPLSHSLSSLFLLPPPFSFHFQESQFVFYPAEGEY